MRARRNVAGLSTSEQAAFADAVVQVRSKPSLRGLAQRYDDFARIHIDSMRASPSWGHGGPAFTAWHRVLLAKFEEELRAVDPTVRIPFWDWTIDRTPASPPWLVDLLGGDGGPVNPVGSQSGEVTTGPFRHSAGDWHITTGQPQTNDDPFNRDYLARGFARRPDASQLPTTQQQNTVLGQSLYSQFVDGLEVDLHNLVHRWVNGQMLLRASPMDPVFWMHHCNADRLWAMWMRGRPAGDRYTADASAPSFHQPTGTLKFHDAAIGPATPAWPGTWRPVDVLDDHAFGVWYEGDPPQVILETPSVSFVDVEAGRTTYAAILFRVEAADSVGFEVTSTVPAPFGLPPALTPPAPVPPGDAAVQGRVWLSFSAGGTGPVSPITVTVRCLQTGQTWAVPVTANAVPVRTSAVALVADRSGSMGQDAGNQMSKRQKLGQALGIVAGLVRDADELALVGFDDQRDVLVTLGQAGAPGGGGARDALAAAATSPDLDPRGLTGIGAAIQLGVGELAGATSDTAALVVVTDGVENVTPYIADVASAISSRTFAIGIGRPSDVNTAALTAISDGNDGYLLLTGDLAGEELFRLHKYFLQVHAGVTDQQIVTDPAGELTLGAEHRIPFLLTRAELGADAIVLCPVPQALTVSLEAPDGTPVDATTGPPAVQPLAGDWLAGLRLSLPVPPAGDPVGTWTAVVAIDETKLAGWKEPQPSDDALRRRGALPYSFVVTCRSDLVLRLQARRSDPTTAEVVASLTCFGIPFWGEARLHAAVTDPAGMVTSIALDRVGPGWYAAKLDVPAAGLYAIRVVARGRLDTDEFTREALASIGTVSGEPSESATEPDQKPRSVRSRRLRPLDVASALRAARAPIPLPEPESFAVDAVAAMTARHTGEHNLFPGRDEVPRNEPWETLAQARRRRGNRRAGRRKGRSGGGGAE